MKLKKLFLSVAVALGLVSAAATTVNAEATFNEDFNNQATRGALGSFGSGNTYNIYGLDTSKVTVGDLPTATLGSWDGNEAVKFSVAKGVTGCSELRMRNKGQANGLYNNPGESAIINFRYKSTRTYDKDFLLWETNLKTIYVSLKSVSGGVWHDVSVVIYEGGESADKIYTYVDGLLFNTTTLSTPWDGKLTQFGFRIGNGNGKTVFGYPEDIYLDYVTIDTYSGGSATVQETVTVKATESIDLPTPEITGTPSIPKYNVKVSDAEVLEIKDGKIWGLKEGTATVTYDFIDELISDVTTTVTVEAAPAVVVVSDISQNNIFGDPITIVTGVGFRLNSVYSALPADADNATLSYEVVDGDSVQINGGLLVAVKPGTSKLKVSAAGENAHTETFDIVVKAGNYADLNDYEVGTKWTEGPDMPTVFSGWEVVNQSKYRDNFAEIEIVQDSFFGKAIKFTGKGTNGNGKDSAASRIEKHIPVTSLTANKDYKFGAWVKVENLSAADNQAAYARFDLMVSGYKLDDQGKPVYSTVAPFATSKFQKKDIAGDGWVYVEFGGINLDTTKLDGFKIELVGFSLVTGVEAYIAAAHLVEEDEVKLHTWNVSNQGKTVELSNDGELQIEGTAVPSAATLPALTYSSSDEEIATVSATGLIKAGTKEGTATITITDGTTTKTITVVVDLVAEDVEISEEAVEMNPEQELSFDLVVTPSYGTSVFTATSSNPEVVTVAIVDGKLVINSVSVGTATIVISTEESDAEFTLTVEVSHAPTLNLSSASASIMVTQTVQIEATANYVEGTISYVSSDETVATVNASGLVTAVKVGTATITVSVDGLTKEFVVTVTELVAQSLTLAENAAQIKEGNTVQINATVTPAGRTITYASSDATIATVNASGLVTAVKAGTATITVTSDSLNKTFTVTVIEQTKIELTATTVTIKENKTHTIDVTVTPAGHTPVFVSSNPQVATVTADGVVKGVKPGTATITITADDKTATFTVVVEEQTAQAISVNKDKATLEIGKTLQLEATVVPANRTITFETSDATIAKVSESGLITAVKAGKAIIKVKSDDKVVEVEITVVEPAVEEPTPTPTPEPTPTPTPTPEPSKKGCKGSVIGSIIAATTLAGAALILKKKKDEE